ncbi:NAD(P)/FAD-dependent oxidoreductase [Streptomyces sp. 3211]|uniref:NAD(P)/FAD-dependent oxidoreductase n=1 Tax=Streptomyces sp. 3211 TaxID=1964449 RepID=UPI001331155F|nr:FAD-binding oxidoreductase [Streptomyces sp. 3211]
MADVAVIGAGVVGLSTAWMLAEAGTAVTVLDSSSSEGGASGRAHGEIVPPAATVQPLWRETLAIYQRLAEHNDFGWDHTPVGTIITADRGEEKLLLARKHANDTHRVATRLVRAPELKTVEPAVDLSDGCALLLTEGRKINPHKAVAALAGSARAAGAALRCGVTVVGLQRTAGRWRVMSSDGRIFEATKVVLATGLGTSQLAQEVGCRIPLVGVHGRILLTEPLPTTLTRIVSAISAGPAAFAATRTTLRDLATPTHKPAAVASLMHQRQDGRFAIGASWSPALLPEGRYPATRIAKAAIRRVPILADAVIEGSWSGVRPYAVDGRPVIDEIAEGLYTCCGHGGEGFILGPGSARLMSQIVLNRPPICSTAEFSATRFSESLNTREP